MVTLRRRVVASNRPGPVTINKATVRLAGAVVLRNISAQPATISAGTMM
jgi:hypothetical protein